LIHRVTPRPYYRKAHPGPADVLLVIEVMVTSADYDHKVKLGLYARSGIPEVWLVDLNNGSVEVHRQPAGSVYAEKTELARGQSLSPGAFPDVVLGVDAILG
ncbi:MAG: Uma2 family endonuclease, partial [Planctomycetia bacterium]|nr:Uma2 family endonuclease [Planctomycetia bacterium]